MPTMLKMELRAKHISEQIKLLYVNPNAINVIMTSAKTSAYFTINAYNIYRELK